MRVDGGAICPKCDADLDRQHDGSTRVVDIAHHGETVEEAMAALRREIDGAHLRPAQFLRLVVGTGLIGEAALAELSFHEGRRNIGGFRQEPGNRGAILVRLK
ncbi:MAG: Smr/MutS family protein [Gammaproteobacteria bacterium]|nr:Smr/MutS family protein [Gammaproteobacteria bacterium]